MRNTLLNFSIFIILTVFAKLAYAQTPAAMSSAEVKKVREIPTPLFIVNSIIVGDKIISQLETQAIKNTVIYRGLNAPGIYANLTTAGIVVITSEEQIANQSFAELAAQRRVSGRISFLLNGHELNAAQATTIRINPESIEQLHITPPSTAGGETTVSIQVASSKPDTSKHLPGTVRIR